MGDVLQFWHADTEDKTADEQRRALGDVELAKKIGAFIESVYSGHWPKVLVDSEGGIIVLQHLLLPPRMGYIIGLSEFNSDPGMKCILRGWGEILERFNMPRGRISREQFRQARNDYRDISNGNYRIELNMATGRLKTVIPTEVVR